MKKSHLFTALCLLISALGASAAQLTLSWTDNSDNETGFAIERAVGTAAPLEWTEITTVGTNVTTYVDTSVATGATYSYRVRAWNAGGYSDYSNTASASTVPPAPNAPGPLLVPDEPALVVVNSDVRINGNLIVAGIISTEPPAE